MTLTHSQRLRIDSLNVILSTLRQAKLSQRIYRMYRLRGLLDWSRQLGFGPRLINVPSYAISDAARGYVDGYIRHTKQLALPAPSAAEELR